MFQNLNGGISRKSIAVVMTGFVLALVTAASPAAAQSRKIVLPTFATVSGLAVLSGPEGPSLTQIAALLPPAVRLKPLTPEARGVSRLEPLPTSAAPRLQGSEQAPAVAGVAIPDDLPRAVQSELKRIGCYSGGVDGDWGNGSRRAMERFYAAKKLDKGEVEPTEAVWRSIAAEAEGTCKPEPVAAKKTTTKKPSTKKSGTTAKKPTAPAKKAPSGGGGSPSCKFIGIAIICS